ncbi:PREDICTED: alpha-L-arabinofuranosidase 2-like [Camelina sativa]|uniref:non-reducing end alpha-L-arabinofuranosidase n=1 Tax=Camelina sativa TaxID=90675 RepID=A0ABM0Y138_CAMSA|nr:PREDICTED: alpha-L-arabinofuranosidase 2-like [Camelina sativa]XP_010493872.1 PREDICTED: alpha-L-arabinofuranosidase 2-like [Camelina sativa]
MDMKTSCRFFTSVCMLLLLLGSSSVYQSLCLVDAQEDAIVISLQVDASNMTRRPIPDTLFGIFFEEINHAGAGGLWAELVSNRGFEAGGQNIPSNIWPWSVIGDESSIYVVTDRSSCFERNKMALKMEVLCDSNGSNNSCPSGGVGVYNPGYWGMNIKEGKKYIVVFYMRSTGDIDLSVSFTSSNGSLPLASENIKALGSEVSNWTRTELVLQANGTDNGARLQFTTTKKGLIWFDQVSAMPMDTYKGRGFRNDLIQMMVDLKPRFLRFPGGCFVEGDWLGNAFRWKETVGAWEERPGHYGDVWKYWTDDGLGHFEFFQLAEDIGATPVWVFNNGISHNDQVETQSVMPFVQEALDGIEFARGDSNSTWGSVRAAMGHPEPFELKYVAVGNEDCPMAYYRGNYLVFYDAIKKAYPDIKIISNCDASSQPLDHPADYFDYHIYTLAKDLFNRSHDFDNTPRNGPKAFVSEYAVNKTDANAGNLLAALGEAAFLLGLEKNSDIVGMVSYAPLFVNTNDRRWIPDAIVFNSSHLYGTPSYWVQQFFTESSGATLLSSILTGNSSLVKASAISFQTNGKDCIQIKAVNIGENPVSLKVEMTRSIAKYYGSKKKVLTSTNLMDENSFSNPKMIVPQESLLEMTEEEGLMFVLPPHSLSSFDLLKESANITKIPISDSHKKASTM